MKDSRRIGLPGRDVWIIEFSKPLDRVAFGLRLMTDSAAWCDVMKQID
jgi:hypothetical protein